MLIRDLRGHGGIKRTSRRYILHMCPTQSSIFLPFSPPYSVSPLRSPPHVPPVPFTPHVLVLTMSPHTLHAAISLLCPQCHACTSPHHMPAMCPPVLSLPPHVLPVPLLSLFPHTLLSLHISAICVPMSPSSPYPSHLIVSLTCTPTLPSCPMTLQCPSSFCVLAHRSWGSAGLPCCQLHRLPTVISPKALGIYPTCCCPAASASLLLQRERSLTSQV